MITGVRFRVSGFGCQENELQSPRVKLGLY